ncbi:hypothetical protein MYO4S_00282 [Serratia phage 4S]|nr:hypothetical protein MYO4S_00282 [Serratia phage 4S]
MRAFHTKRKTVEVPYRLHSGMIIQLIGLSSEWFTVNAQSYCDVRKSNILVASNRTASLTLNGSNASYEKLNDYDNAITSTWEPGKLLAALKGTFIFRPVSRIAETNELCIFVPVPVREKQPVRKYDIIVDVEHNDWVVVFVSVGGPITLEQVTDRSNVVCIHPEDKDLQKKYNVEFEDESSIRQAAIKETSRN